MEDTGQKEKIQTISTKPIDELFIFSLDLSPASTAHEIYDGEVLEIL